MKGFAREAARLGGQPDASRAPPAGPATTLRATGSGQISLATQLSPSLAATRRKTPGDALANPVKRISHLTFIVRDPDRMAAFLCEGLGARGVRQFRT